MKFLSVIVLATLGFSVFSAAQDLPQLPSIFIRVNESYVGQEYINQIPTGHTCRIFIKNIEQTNFGSHCYKLQYQFDTYSGAKQILSTFFSELTTPENAKNKSCAIPLVADGKASIFDRNGALLYTPFFMGSKDMGLFKGTEDYFLWFSNGNKRPVKAAFNQVKPLSEHLYECLNLK